MVSQLLAGVPIPRMFRAERPAGADSAAKGTEKPPFSSEKGGFLKLRGLSHRAVRYSSPPENARMA